MIKNNPKQTFIIANIWKIFDNSKLLAYMFIKMNKSYV